MKSFIFLFLTCLNIVVGYSQGTSPLKPAPNVGNWVVYSNSEFDLKFPEEPIVFDTLNLLFASNLLPDSSLELSCYVLDSVNYTFRNEFTENTTINEFDNLGMAFAKTLIARDSSEILNIVDLSINIDGGINNGSGEGHEIVHRYFTGEFFVLEFIRVFEFKNKIFVFSVGGADVNVFSIYDYRTIFFNSIIFKNP